MVVEKGSPFFSWFEDLLFGLLVCENVLPLVDFENELAQVLVFSLFPIHDFLNFVDDDGVFLIEGEFFGFGDGGEVDFAVGLGEVDVETDSSEAEGG